MVYLNASEAENNRDSSEKVMIDRQGHFFDPGHGSKLDNTRGARVARRSFCVVDARKC